MKRFVFFAILTIFFSLSAVASPFSDVSEKDYFYDDVKSVYELELINGKGEGTFKPNDPMTYAEAIKLAACMHEKYTSGKVTLTNGSPWYQSFVDYCLEKGIIDKEYPYNDIVTRAGYMKIFSKAIPLSPMNTVPLGSIPDVSKNVEGYEGIYKLYRAGIVAGVDTLHNCSPDTNIKRSEVAIIVNRMMNEDKRIAFTVSKEEKAEVETFTLPSKKQWENYTFGKKGDKTVAEQRKEILDAMTRAMNTEVAWKEVPKFNPTIEKYSHIKAISYDGLEYKGEKTKVFAYIGFPEKIREEASVPAVVLVHGGGGHPYLEWIRIWNEKGYAAIAMDTTGFFPTTVNAGVTEGAVENAKYVYGMTADFMEEGYVNAPNRSYVKEYTEVNEQWAYHGISQVILAGNILRQDKRVDPDNIGITGISWGGVTATQVIGYDNRFSFAIPIYGMAYLGDEMSSFGSFKDPYVDALWAAERNLQNATMPILWLAYNDDNNFAMNQYVNSFKKTAGLNAKNSLVMLSSWGHSHGHGWNKAHSYYFADWATWGETGFATFITQPKGREINCKINIPDNITGTVTAYIYYITEPMSYSKHNKFGWGNYMFLDQNWQKTRDNITVDKKTGMVTGTVPEDAKGYYINLSFKAKKGVNERTEVSSVYVPLD